MSRRALRLWAPAALLLVGAAFTVGIDTQKVVPLRADLAATVPDRIDDLVSSDIEVSDAELTTAGVTSYLMRAYHAPGASPAEAAFTLYVGYYDQQMQGKTIHSPKNCLPGAGWEALQSERVVITTPAGEQFIANRYLLQREEQRALVLYWYQGRGRIEANEYLVKANLLRDAALRGRSEEALVRIVVPVTTTFEDASAVAEHAAGRSLAGVRAALPI